MKNHDCNQILKSTRNILRITYGIVPVVSGIDKFSNLITKWDNYLNPAIGSVLPFSVHTFMMIIGVIEIGTGILVFVKPGIGGFIGAIWLTIIAFTILASGNYLDTAVRDLVMAVGAYSLSKITKLVEPNS
jgi:uncharacterized membrane protein YphA (DoxX/SURF4 family)